jgi:hypothetical protein
MLGLQFVIRRSGQRAWATMVPALHSLYEGPCSEERLRVSNPGLLQTIHLRYLQRAFTATAASVPEPVVYRLDIVTGDVRGAGTTVRQTNFMSLLIDPFFVADAYPGAY